MTQKAPRAQPAPTFVHLAEEGARRWAGDYLDREFARRLTKTCIFDNPTTMCREVWAAGRPIAGVSLAALSDPAITRFINVDLQYPWQPGQCRGDNEALRAP